MPPKPSTLSAQTSDPDNEVVCPIRSADGNGCRKKCLGEKRFRSMQEHIRRAHPEYYIPKLPATKESFELMVNSPPHERVPRLDVWSPTSAPRQPRQLASEDQYAVSDPAGSGPIQPDGFYPDGMSSFPDDYRRGSLLPAANAAAALASLHYARPDGPEGGWENDQNFFVDHIPDAKRAHFVDPTLGPDQQFLDSQYQQDPPEETPGLLPSSMTKSPPSRHNTIPPVPRSASRLSRPRKSSLSHSARKAKHERQKAKGHFRNTSHERKALSAEPNMYGKRWEDLIDAATSATEEDSRDLTPMPVSPYRSPPVQSRTSLPPFALGSQFQSYTASPLQQTLTPPPADDAPNPLDMHPFPSVENEATSSSIDSTQSGANFHIMPSNASDSSPMFSNPVQIYCAGCRRLSVLRESYACPECICGLCPGCVETLIGEQNRGRIAQCPGCRTMGGRFKKFNLDLR
ncbi:hypothetical protein BDV97DRAFT_139129 [Delphinella strobiligena]|nr:hypothetical protein BDV97DRAFT_139129 [Delphinella strobiligena]